MTDARITEIFDGAGDFIRRELECSGFKVYAYAIDGLISGADAAEYVFQPIATNLTGDSMETLYRKALCGSVYNTVAGPCQDAEDVAVKLVNGFCVVLFPGCGAVAYEVRTGVTGSTGSGKHGQRPEGCLRGDYAYQYQCRPPTFANPGLTAVADDSGKTQSYQCDRGLDPRDHQSGVGDQNAEPFKTH